MRGKKPKEKHMTEKVRIVTPVGRLINNALWEKDAYKDEKGREGKAQYKVEMAFTWEEIKELEDAMVAACVETWGDGAEDMYFEQGSIRSAIHDGDELAAEREKKGKKGDAYRGLAIMRAGTIYNANGDDAPGGVYVADENAEPLDFANRGKVYNGCYGIAVVEPSTSQIDGVKRVSLYLQGFQFARDGERLRGDNVSSLFKPMGAESEGESKGRRARR